MANLIFFDPEVPIGTVRDRADGNIITYISAKEYYLKLVGRVSTITPVFISLGSPQSALPLETRIEIDDAIAEAYWEKYQGLLIPPRVLAAIHKAHQEPKGELMLQFLESARRSILTEEVSLEEAMERQIEYRIRALKLGAEDRLTDRQTAVSEAFTDLLLLQKASMEDVRKAEKERGPGVPRSDVLNEMEKKSELAFEKTLPTIINTQRLLQEIPNELKPLIEAYAQRRKPYHRTGIFIAQNDEK